MNLLKQLLADDTGAPSSMRCAFLFVVFAVVTVWAVLCIKAGQFIMLPSGVLEMLVLFTGGKVVQSFSENFSAGKTPAAAPETPKPQAP
jgi:hypothetical protein